MKYRNTFTLFIIALALGISYFFYFQPMLEEKKLIEDFEKRFFRADTSDIEFIRLDTGQGPVTITRSGDSWKITKPAEYAPDLGAIESLFKALAKGRLIKIVGDAEDLDDFGFKTVHIILSLGYSGNIDVMRIAGESPSAAGHYAFSERLGKIFLVDKEFVNAMNLKLLDLREKRLFIFEPDDLGRIRIRRKSGPVEFLKSGDVWQMTSPFSMIADKNDIEILINTLYTQKAEAFFKWKPEHAKLERKIFVEFNNTSAMPLGSYEIYFWGTEWDKGIVVHRPGSNEAFRVRRELWDLLNGDYSKFLYRNLISIDPKVPMTLSIVSGSDTYLIENKGNKWYFNGFPVDAWILELIESLNSFKAIKIIDEDRDLGKDRIVINVKTEKGISKIKISNFNMDHEISSAAMFAARKGKTDKEKVDYLYARSSNLENAAIVSSIDIENILDILRSLGDE